MRSTRLALVAGLALLLASPALAGDIIVSKNGRLYGNAKAKVPPTDEDYAGSNISVVEEKLDEVTFTIAGVATPQSLDAKDVDRVFHDPSTTPSGLLRGRKLLDNGQYEDAFDLLSDVANDANAPKWAQAEAAYRAGEALWMAGVLDDATKAFDAFTSKYKTSKYVPSATQANARIKLAKGDVEGSRASFSALKKMPGLPEAEALEIDYWLAWIEEQVAQKKNDKAGLEKALKAYEALGRTLKGRAGLEELYGKCQVGAISCMLSLGRTAEGQSEAEKVIEASKDPLVRAGAHTLLGRAIVLQNVTNADKAKFKEALLHFLKVVTLYGNEPGAEEWMAESLYRAGELFNELRPSNPQTDEEKDANRMAQLRARREWRECRDRFPRSEWAKKAAVQLGGS